MGILGDYSSLEGQTVSPSTTNTLWGVWDRLTAYDRAMQPQPMLAETWEVSADGRQIKLSLRKGVTFHTGRELTSEDVRWSLERFKDPKVGTLAGRAQLMTDFAAPDKSTIIVTTNRPWVEVFDFFEYANIIDPVTFQASGVDKPVGTGPFQFTEYVQGDHLRLVKNKNYWRSGRPYLDEVLVQIFRDPQSEVVQLESGSLDTADQLNITDVVRLRSDARYQVLVNDRTGGFWCVMPNATRPPTSDKRVRQALSYALDRERIADQIWKGISEKEALPWSPTSPAFDPGKRNAYVFDLDRARALLADAGQVNLQMDLNYSAASADSARLAQIYQADLAKIGVNATIKSAEGAAFTGMMVGVAYSGVAITAGLNGHLKPPTMILGPYYGPQFNWAGFKDAAYDQLSQQVLVENDPNRQKDLYAQLNDYWLDQAWIIPISQNPPRLAARPAVQGLGYDGHESLVLSELWLQG